MALPVDPAAQVKGLKLVAAIVTFGGLLVGIGMPLLYRHLGIKTGVMLWGVDVIWLAGFAVMIADFAIAWFLLRRASALDRTAQGLPSRGE